MTRLVRTTYRGCEPSERIVAMAAGPFVRVRSLGERTLSEVPFTELAAAAERVMSEQPDADAEMVSRAVINAYNTRRLTEGIAAVMDRAIQIARRERAKAAREDAGWARMHRAIAAIPEGSWTSLADLAELVNTSTGWVGRHLYGKWHLANLHRVLELDGSPWRWFLWPAGNDRGSVIEVLRSEGAIPAGAEIADPSKRVDAAALARLVDSGE